MINKQFFCLFIRGYCATDPQTIQCFQYLKKQQLRNNAYITRSRSSWYHSQRTSVPRRRFFCNARFYDSLGPSCNWQRKFRITINYMRHSMFKRLNPTSGWQHTGIFPLGRMSHPVTNRVLSRRENIRGLFLIFDCLAH